MNKILCCIFLFACCLTFAQCVLKKPTTAQQCESAIYSTIGKSRKVLCNRYNMHAVACGLGMPSAVAHEITIYFEINKPLDLDQLLAIVVDCVNEMVLQANANKEFRLFMQDYPFTYKNIFTSVTARNIDGSEIKAPGISSVDSFRGEIYYTIQGSDQTQRYEYPGTFEDLSKKYAPDVSNQK